MRYLAPINGISALTKLFFAGKTQKIISNLLTIIMLSLLLSVPTWLFAEQAPDNTLIPSPSGTESAQKAEGKPGEQISELTIVAKNKREAPEDFVFKMGEPLQIKATGARAAMIKKDLATKSLTLYLNGVPMTNLTPGLLQNPAGTELSITFDLIRDAQKEENRKAWDTLFKKADGYSMIIKPALAVGNDIPTPVQSKWPFLFHVATSSAIYGILIIGLTILLVSYSLLVTRTNMLRDEETGYYSLGKSQMAFWGFLVLLGFTGVWILTGAMERIPPQTLILLGISGATGLSAIVIGDSKRSEAKSKIAKLQDEKHALQDKQANNPPTITAADQSRLAAIPQEIGILARQLGPGQSNGFWRDICDDSNGTSFHRLQVVLWTMVLGAVFVRYMAQTMSMPEFSDTLLTLLGISNATYLGFKIPEKP